METCETEAFVFVYLRRVWFYRGCDFDPFSFMLQKKEIPSNYTFQTPVTSSIEYKIKMTPIIFFFF